MSTPLKLSGIIPIIPTPFTDADEIDIVASRGLVEFAIAAGANAICLPAYASEFYKLDAAERLLVVETAVDQARGRVPVLGQVNYPSARHAVEAARAAQRAGVSAINCAVPRMFGVGDRDLLRYFGRLLDSIDVPLVIQDFNPGGPTISPKFITELHRAHPNFRYVKLEEAMMGAKVEAILHETGGEVGVMEGWGGLYMLELIPMGICAVMPGLAVSDLLNRVWTLTKDQRLEEAYEVFQGVVPQIFHSLQNMEFFHQAEKLLLQDRGVLPSANVRDLRIDLDERDTRYIHFLNGRVMALLDRLAMPRNPTAKVGA
jgi:dihydrodipicolinate synthase/N-acetylneuraminate lyase